MEAPSDLVNQSTLPDAESSSNVVMDLQLVAFKDCQTNTINYVNRSVNLPHPTLGKKRKRNGIQQLQQQLQQQMQQ
jgi:hypothetical protein